MQGQGLLSDPRFQVFDLNHDRAKTSSTNRISSFNASFLAPNVGDIGFEAWMDFVKLGEGEGIYGNGKGFSQGYDAAGDVVGFAKGDFGFVNDVVGEVGCEEVGGEGGLHLFGMDLWEEVSN